MPHPYFCIYLIKHIYLNTNLVFDKKKRVYYYSLYNVYINLPRTVDQREILKWQSLYCHYKQSKKK